MALRPLPNLPTASATVTFDKDKLDSELGDYVLKRYQNAGVAPQKPNFFQRRAYTSLASATKPAVEALIKRHGDILDTRQVNFAIDSASHNAMTHKTRVRSLWIGGGIALLAMTAGGIAGWSFGVGFKALGVYFASPTLATTIQTAFNPVWFSLMGMATGAAASFFNDNISNPLRAWIIRLGMHGNPDNPNFDPVILAEMIYNWSIEQTVDGRVLGMRYAQTLDNVSLQLSLEGCGTELKAARKATDPKEKNVAMENAAEFLSGALTSAETMWFYITPDSIEVFGFMMMLLRPYLYRATDAERQELVKKTLELVRETRPAVENNERADTETAIKKYYEPFLDVLMSRASKAVEPKLAKPTIDTAVPTEPKPAAVANAA